MSEIDPQLLKHKYLYVPYSERIDTMAIGKAVGLYVAQQHRASLTVVTVQKSNAVFHPEFKNLTVVTERSGTVREGGIVIAWCPTMKVMDKISHLAESIVVAVEWPATRLEGWAKLVGAYNVFTRQAMQSGLSEAGTRALNEIVEEGYNGWHDDIARTLALGHLQELRDSGSYDREIVLAFARRAKGEYSIGNLVKILDTFESSSPGSTRSHLDL